MYRDSDFDELAALLNTAVDWETDQRLYSEWLAFTPITALIGKQPVNFAEFKIGAKVKPKPKKQASMKDIDAIKKHFNL